MICYRVCAGLILGGCLATVIAWSSLADALPSLLLVTPLSGCFCHHNSVYLAGNLCVVSLFTGSVVGLGCRGQSLSLSFSSFYVYFWSLTTSLVVCNMCYEGSLIVASCNSLLLIKKGYIPDQEKKHEKDITKI
jgi:hypothetical protein